MGCVGWKCYQNRLLGDDTAAGGGPAGTAESTTAMDLPAYLVDLLRELGGDKSAVVNATGMFMSVDDGMRLINEPEQIAQFEYAATVTSQAVLQLLQGIRVGASEQELEHLLDSRGLPLTCHRMIGFGDKAKRGLASPSARRAALGDPFTTAFGVVGALTCRAGCVASGPQDLPAALADFYPRLAANYFAVTAAWYSAVRVGARGGEVFQAAESRRDPALYDFAVNPGHFLHLEEWLNSPFAAGSRSLLKSGMVMQMDIIPVSRGPFCYSNAEDGLALADEARTWPPGPAVSGDVGSHSTAPQVHARDARYRARRIRLAAGQHHRLAAAVCVVAGPCLCRAPHLNRNVDAASCRVRSISTGHKRSPPK